MPILLPDWSLGAKPPPSGLLGRGHPRLRASRCVLPFSGGSGPPVNLVDGARATTAGTVAWRPSRAGPARYYEPPLGGRNYDLFPAIIDRRNMTVLIAFNAGSRPGNRVLWSASGSGNSEARLTAATNPPLSFTVGAETLTTSATLANDRDYLAAFVASGANRLEIWVDGRLWASSSPTLTDFPHSDFRTGGSGASGSFGGLIYYAEAIDRALAPGELAEWFADPFALLREPGPTVLDLAALGGGGGGGDPVELGGTLGATFGGSIAPEAIPQASGTLAASFGASASLGTLPPIAGTLPTAFGGSAALDPVPQASGVLAAAFGGSATLDPVPQASGTLATAFGGSSAFDGAAVSIAGTLATAFGGSAALDPVPQASGVLPATFGGSVGLDAIPSIAGTLGTAFGGPIAFGSSAVQLSGTLATAFGGTIAAASVPQGSGTLATAFGGSALFGAGPQVVSASVGASGLALTVAFDRAVEASGDPAAGWAVAADGAAVAVASAAIGGDGRSVVLALGSTITADQSVLLSYDPE